MANRQSNVLQFNANAVSRSDNISPDAAQELSVCRDRLAHGVATAFAENMGKANDDLLGMADRATSLEHQQLYFAAMDFLSNHGQTLLQQFRGAYVRLFDSSLAALREGRRQEHTDELSELRLVDTDDFERDLAVGKLSARAACNCSNQLTALDRRLAALLNVPRISQDDNPLYPRALFSAMLRAFSDMEAGEALSLTLLQEFERQTSVELPGIYNDLNRHLADYGVLPKIPVGLTRPVRRADASDSLPERGSASDGEDDTPLMEPAGSMGRPGVEGTSAPGLGGSAGVTLDAGADNVFAQLAQAIQAAAAKPRTDSLQRAPVETKGPEGPGPSLGVSQLIDALTSLQRGRADTRHLPGLGSTSIDPSGGQVLQQLRSTPMVNWSHPVDALTIDIVAMLFDAIFNDPDLPAAVRAQIAKLQIPVLKVALMDKAFFSNKKHPARRLLDLIANAALGRNEADEPRLTAKIGSIVDTVVSGFETEIDIFATQVQKLEEFLEDEDVRAQTRTTQVVTKLERRDRREVAKPRVAEEINTRVHRQQVPSLVSDFLDRYWRLVLVGTFVSAGEESASWRDALSTMDELLWSVEPKQGSEDRNRLLTALPDLLKRLRTGLESAGLEDAWDPFFAQLIRLHVGALHKDIPKEEYPEPTAKDSAEARSDSAQGEGQGLKTLELVDSPSRIEYHVPERDEPKSQPAKPVDRHTQLVESLGVGAWVEFQSFRGTRKTLRLSWVSDFRGVYLFTNRQGENALTLATTSLAEHMRKGTARVLSQDRLTDRAVAQLLGQANSLDAMRNPQA